MQNISQDIGPWIGYMCFKLNIESGNMTWKCLWTVSREVVGWTVRDHITARQIIAGGQTPRTEREWRSGKPQMVTQYLQGGNLKLKWALPLVEERMMIPAALETMGQFSYSVLFCRPLCGGSFSCWELSPFCPWTMLLMYMLKVSALLHTARVARSAWQN